MKKGEIFNKVEMTRPTRSLHDLSYDHVTTTNMGWLVPACVQFCMPGDKHRLSHEALVRFLPMVAPPMHRYNVTYHTFFCPTRLVWENWVKWATNTKVGSVLPAHPTFNLSASIPSTWTKLMDHMTIPDPNGMPVTETISALVFAVYQCIINEYYRDENLVPEIPFMLNDGDNTANTELFKIRRRAWNHDYFTSCLPFAQKGDPVSMPFNFTDVRVALPAPSEVLAPQWQDPSLWNNGIGTRQPSVSGAPAVGITTAADELFARTSQLEGSSTINELRIAEALQKWLERAARGGSRYTEWILSMYGVKSSDARLQRPEYIGGSKTQISISEVLNTTGTNDAPQGNMAGHGLSAVRGFQGGYFCEEFGFIMTIMSIMPEAVYSQGLNKTLFGRFTDPSELPNPIFAHLGEQEVLVRELYAFDATSDEVFGYLPRFAEDRFNPSVLTGQVRPGKTLDFWTSARQFTTPPALNEDFINCNPTFRIFADTDPDLDHILVHTYNNITSLRPLPKFATPALS